jgi:hypothetical protein
MIVDPSNRDCTCSRNVKKPLCEENYETGPQTLSVRLRFLTIRAEGCTLTTQIINQIRRQITDPETLHFDSRVRRQTSRTVYQAGFVVSRHVNYRRGVFPALMGYISDFSTIRTAFFVPLICHPRSSACRYVHMLGGVGLCESFTIFPSSIFCAWVRIGQGKPQHHLQLIVTWRTIFNRSPACGWW